MRQLLGRQRSREKRASQHAGLRCPVQAVAQEACGRLEALLHAEGAHERVAAVQQRRLPRLELLQQACKLMSAAR